MLFYAHMRMCTHRQHIQTAHTHAHTQTLSNGQFSQIIPLASAGNIGTSKRASLTYPQCILNKCYHLKQPPNAMKQ